VKVAVSTDETHNVFINVFLPKPWLCEPLYWNASELPTATAELQASKTSARLTMLLMCQLCTRLLLKCMAS